MTAIPSLRPAQIDDGLPAGRFLSAIHPARVREWLPEVPEQVAHALLDDERLRPLLARIATRHYRIAGDWPAIPYTDRHIANLPYTSLVKLSAMAGVVWNARHLRIIIDRQELIELVADVDEDAYRAAMSLADAMPGRAEHVKPADRLTAKQLRRDGACCFFSWLATLPAVCRKEVSLKFPPDSVLDLVPSEFKDHGPEIIRIIGKGLIFHDGN